MTSSKSSSLPTILPPNTIPLGVGASPYVFLEDNKYSVHSSERAARRQTETRKQRKIIQEHCANMPLISKWALPDLGFVKGHGGWGLSSSGPVLQMGGEGLVAGY